MSEIVRKQEKTVRTQFFKTPIPFSNLYYYSHNLLQFERVREREKKEKEKKKTIRSRTVHSHFTLSDHFCLFYFIFYYLFSERRSSFRQNSKIEKLELKCSSSDSNSLRNTCWKIRAWMVWEAEQQSITRVAHTSIRNIQQAH